MAEYHDPPLRLTIEGLRWLGDTWGSWGEPAGEIDLLSTDTPTDEAAQILRLLRTVAVRRLRMQFTALGLGLEALDFDSPNAPTEHDVQPLIDHATAVLGSLNVLKNLAAEIVDDDDGEGDPDPEPDPAEGAVSDA